MAMLKLCRCGKKIDYNKRYCDDCIVEVEQEKKQRNKKYDKEVRYNLDNKQYADFYNSKAWRTLSELVKSSYNGVCVMCLIEEEKIKDADTTHHIEELKENWELRLDKNNLIPLCHACHNYVHQDYTDIEKKYLRKIINKYKTKY